MPLFRQQHPWMRAVPHWAGWVSLAAGGVLCVIGWYGTSGERFVEQQIPYLASSTVPGAALIVAGAVLLARGEQAVAAERIEELHRLLVSFGDVGGAAEAGRGPAPPLAEDLGPAGAAPPGRAPSSAAASPAEADATAGPPREQPRDRAAHETTPALFAVPGGTLAHRPDCPLVAGKPQAFHVSETVRLEQALRACPVCEPEFGRPEPPGGVSPAGTRREPEPDSTSGPGREAQHGPQGRHPPGPEPPPED